MHAETAARSEDLSQRWNVLATDPEAPDYYELNEFGDVILRPRPTNLHQLRVQSVADELNRQLGPRAVSKVSVLTDRGIRVPDVSWMPAERWKSTGAATPLPFVPDVCVEVLSPGNTPEEIAMKIGAYLRGGAREVIVVSVSGEVSFHGPEGRRNLSALGIVLNLGEEPV